MHCQVVGIAMVIALLLVNWELPAAVAASAPSAPLALEAAKRLEERLRKRFGRCSHRHGARWPETKILGGSESECRRSRA